MSEQKDVPPKARLIYFTGALAVVDRQLDHLCEERKRIACELEQAREELRAATGTVEPAGENGRDN